MTRVVKAKASTATATETTAMDATKQAGVVQKIESIIFYFLVKLQLQGSSSV